MGTRSAILIAHPSCDACSSASSSSSCTSRAAAGQPRGSHVAMRYTSGCCLRAAFSAAHDPSPLNTHTHTHIDHTPHPPLPLTSCGCLGRPVGLEVPQQLRKLRVPVLQSSSSSAGAGSALAVCRQTGARLWLASGAGSAAVPAADFLAGLRPPHLHLLQPRILLAGGFLQALQLLSEQLVLAEETLPDLCSHLQLGILLLHFLHEPHDDLFFVVLAGRAGQGRATVRWPS